MKLTTNYKYDHQGQLLSEKMKINDGTEITLTSYKYNELGEQIAKYLHGSSSGSDFNQKVDYKYNIKGWLRTLNTVNNLGTDLFALDLRYNIPGSADALTASARHNGNISEMRWDTGTPKGYGFTYDGLSRLTAADYADGSSFTSNQNSYNTFYGYDANGNLSSLSRYLNATQIDNLTYTYISSGNRLQSVNDATSNPNGYDDNNGTYTYDDNGNLGYDPSKGTYLSYNYLNLPEQVQFGANDNLRYTYDAAGNKLVKVVDGTVAGNNTRLDYSGNFLYENNELKAIFTSAGRIVPFDNNGNIVYKFEYNLQDHLGNTRVVFSGHSNGQPEVMQVTDYYPFGLVMNQQNYFADGVLSNKYLYNNKELQDDELAGNSLGWYDYGARFYDPELGRWHSVDPLASDFPSWAPYHYVHSNPIGFIDPTGMAADWFEDENKKLVYDENVKSQEDLDKAGIQGNYVGKEGYGINEETGLLQHYTKDGNIEESSLASNDITVRGNPVLAGVHKGHRDFVTHPVTKTTANTLLFVATGGVEGVVSLTSSGIQGAKLLSKQGTRFLNYADDIALKSYVRSNLRANYYKNNFISKVSKKVWNNSSLSTKKWMIRNDVTSNMKTIYNTNYEFFGPQAFDKYYKIYDNTEKVIQIVK